MHIHVVFYASQVPWGLFNFFVSAFATSLCTFVVHTVHESSAYTCYKNGFFLQENLLSLKVLSSETAPAEIELKGGALKLKKGSHRMGDGPIFLKTYEMKLFSARSVLLDSNFNGLFVIVFPVYMYINSINITKIVLL